MFKPNGIGDPKKTYRLFNVINAIQILSTVGLRIQIRLFFKGRIRTPVFLTVGYGFFLMVGSGTGSTTPESAPPALIYPDPSILFLLLYRKKVKGDFYVERSSDLDLDPGCFFRVGS